CLLPRGTAPDPLALQAGLFHLGTNGVLLRSATQRVAHAGHFLDLAEQGDAAVEYRHGLIGMPVAHVRRFSLSQQVARRGVAVESRRDRILAGRCPRQTTLAPER